MSARLLVMLLAILALSGCATTANEVVPKAVLLDDGHYYFPAQDGNGDYYSQAPERRSTFAFEIGFGYGYFSPYFNHYCSPRAWHCPPWAYWPGHGFDYGWPYAGRPYFGHGYFDDFRDPWRGYGLHHEQRGDHGDRPRRRGLDRLPSDDEALDLAETGLEQSPSPATPPTRRFRDTPGRPGHRRGGYDFPASAMADSAALPADAQDGIENPDGTAPVGSGTTLTPSPLGRRSRQRSPDPPENGSRRVRLPAVESSEPREPGRETPRHDRNSEDGHDHGDQ